MVLDSRRYWVEWVPNVDMQRTEKRCLRNPEVRDYIPREKYIDWILRYWRSNAHLPNEMCMMQYDMNI
jgi:hypothetical protein